MPAAGARRTSRLAALRPAHPRRWFRRVLWWALAAFLIFYGTVLVSLVALRYVDPWTTAVHLERRVESLWSSGHYQKRYRFVPLRRISPHLQHAVIAAEDGRFYQHRGFDWDEIKDAISEDLEKGKLRGASTISQQLVKNLFLTTEGAFIRKGLEFLIVPAAERILTKQRILELYLNVIEWGPGIYGAEAAAQFHYKGSAGQLDRDQAARLAAVLPSPRRWRPARMDDYSARIQQRMSRMGW